MVDSTKPKLESIPNTDELIREAKEFFELNKKEIGKVAKAGERVVRINFEDLSEFSPKLSEFLIEKPEEIIRILELSLGELEWAPSSPRLRLNSISSTQENFIRDIRAKHLNTLIGIEGIVRQSSEVRPQVTNAKFECPSCGTILSILQIDKKFREPSRCSCGRRGGFREIAKDMVDAQALVVEEASENLSGGEQPKRITVFLKEDLVDPKMEKRTTPGSRIKVIGILKEVAIPSSSGAILTRFDLAIEANNIIPMDESYEEIQISEEEELQIRELSKDPFLFEKIARSIAPSIWGYENIKRALCLQLFGGVRKKRSDETPIRSDIHILLVGDPGVAKSVILNFISSIAPKARYVAGKSTTGAGLTATVVRDEFLRGWSLEAGAMVLANKGIVCIDEFDKMNEEDRSTMHEAMEQQTVTISKATVQATLRAQTSVLAAANPKFGRFDPTQAIPKQVNLPPTLLSRFDAIFIMRDIPSKERDESIALKVLSEHKQEAAQDIIEKDFLRKYISYAKQKCNPVLTDEAIEEIKNFYVTLRNQPQFESMPVRPIPIGARQLEALVRFSEAHARMRLSKKVVKKDALEAIKLVKSFLLQVGYDEETKTIDIDKITETSASQRSKISMVREAIESLERKLGKLIPFEEIEKELEGKLKPEEIDEIIGKLLRVGDLFRPKRGYVQRM